MSYGLCKEGGPAILQIRWKDGQTCLLMPWDTVFSGEQQGSGGWGGGWGGVSGGHMSPLLLSARISQACIKHQHGG